MKEYIERAAAMDAILGLTIADPAVAQYADAVCYHLQNLPAADVVEVVRCRECENYDENGDCISLDLRIGIHSDTINYDFCPDPDFYCAYGKRKIETVLPKSDAKDESLEETHANTRKNAR